MLQIAHQGEGPRRFLIIGYLVDSAHGIGDLPNALGRTDVCIVQELDSSHGRFAAPVGHGGVDALADVVEFVHAHAGQFEIAAVILIGWSAGCEAVREQLRADQYNVVQAVLALDGISGTVPPLDLQMAPWYQMVDRARAQGMSSWPLFVATHTQQTYTETLPAAERFAATVTTARMLCERAGIAPPIPGNEATVGNFHVVSCPSLSIDKDAHLHQVRVVLPDMVREYLVPWFGTLQDPGLEEAPDASAPSPTPDALGG